MLSAGTPSPIYVPPAQYMYPIPMPINSNGTLSDCHIACATATTVAARSIDEMMGAPSADSDDHSSSSLSSSSSASLQHVLTTPFEVQWSKSRWYWAVQKKAKEMFIGMYNRHQPTTNIT